MMHPQRVIPLEHLQGEECLQLEEGHQGEGLQEVEWAADLPQGS